MIASIIVSIKAIIIIAIAVIKIYRFSNSKIIKHKIKCHSILPKRPIVKTTYTLLVQKGSIRPMPPIPRRICRLLSRVLHSMTPGLLLLRKFARMGLK